MEFTAEKASRALNWKGFWCFVLIIVGFFSPITKGPFGMSNINGPKLADYIYSSVEAARSYSEFSNSMAVEYSGRPSYQRQTVAPKAFSYIGYTIYILPLFAFAGIFNAFNGNEKQALSYGRVSSILTGLWMLIIYGLTQDTKTAMILGTDLGIGWIIMCASAIALLLFSWSFGPKLSSETVTKSAESAPKSQVSTNIMETTSNFAAKALPTAAQVSHFSVETKKSFSNTFSYAVAFIKVDGMRSFVIGCAVGGFVVYNPGLAAGVAALALICVMASNYLSHASHKHIQIPIVQNAEEVLQQPVQKGSDVSNSDNHQIIS